MKEYLTSTQVARELGVCQKSIWTWFQKGWLVPDYTTPGGRARYHPDAIAAHKKKMGSKKKK